MGTSPNPFGKQPLSLTHWSTNKDMEAQWHYKWLAQLHKCNRKINTLCSYINICIWWTSSLNCVSSDIYTKKKKIAVLGIHVKHFKMENCSAYTYPQPDSETDKNTKPDNIWDPKKSFPFAMKAGYCAHRIGLGMRVPVSPMFSFLTQNIHWQRQVRECG